MKVPVWGWVAGGVFGLMVISAALSPHPTAPAPSAPSVRPEPAAHVKARRALTSSMLALTVTQGDATSLEKIARNECGPRDFCKVFAWQNRDAMAHGFPMTDREAAAMVFIYTVNRNNGFEQSLWNCAVYPAVAKANCMASPDPSDDSPVSN